jgi:hypothetical protein
MIRRRRIQLSPNNQLRPKVLWSHHLRLNLSLKVP